jgi:hypothetical protein
MYPDDIRSLHAIDNLRSSYGVDKVRRTLAVGFPGPLSRNRKSAMYDVVIRDEMMQCLIASTFQAL